MKHALDDRNSLIEANAGAPAWARCPHCGAAVVLRRRRGAGRGATTYFWRHMDHGGAGCPARFVAGQRVSPA